MINTQINISKLSNIYIYIKTTLSNTIVTLIECKETTNLKVIGVISCGSCGFKGRSKNTPFAQNVLATNVINFVYTKGFKNLYIILKGIGIHRQTLIKSLLKQSSYKNLKILYIVDITQAPYNGCRPSKKKRR